MDLNLNDTLDNVSKTLSMPAYSEGPANMRENLSSVVTKLNKRVTPIRDRLPRVTWSGLAAAWNVLTTIWSGATPTAEWAKPTQSASTYVKRHALYKQFGSTKGITDMMINAGKSFQNQEAAELEIAMLELLRDEETFIVTWDINVSALQYDWLKKTIVTNVIDDNNNALGYRPDLLNQAIEIQLSTYDARATAIYNGYGMQRAINDSFTGNVQVNIDSTNSVSSGITVWTFSSVAWVLPFVTSPAVKWDAVTYPWFTVESMYVVVENSDGTDVLYIEELQGMVKQYIGRVWTWIEFMVYHQNVLVNRAEEYHVEIQNVRVK